MKVVACCCTCNRPELLGRIIKCFERQTHENRFLVIIDDLGQYSQPQRGDRWELISFPRRAMSNAEKTNIAAALAPRGTEGYAKWDDDDFYYPWALESVAEGLTRGPLVQPRHAIDFINGEWVQVETFGRNDHPNRYAYHGCWAYSRQMFVHVKGYRARYVGDDYDFWQDYRKLGYDVRSVDIATPPYYVYNRRPGQEQNSSRPDTEEAYYSYPPDSPFIGTVPRWTDESDWERPVPTKIIRRQF